MITAGGRAERRATATVAAPSAAPRPLRGMSPRGARLPHSLQGCATMIHLDRDRIQEDADRGALRAGSLDPRGRHDAEALHD